MTVSVNTLVNKTNVYAENSSITKSTELLQLSSINLDLTNLHIYSVPNLASLPSAANNTGRMIFVQDKKSYRISNGTIWTIDFIN
jgi:hypothetical protein